MSQNQKWSGSDKRNGCIPGRGVPQQIDRRNYCNCYVWSNMYIYGTVVQYAITEQGCASTLGGHANNRFAFMFVLLISCSKLVFPTCFHAPPPFLLRLIFLV